MAQLKVSFGDELKDGFKVVDAWIGNGIRFMDDVQDFYKERATIEREYSAKLTALSAKFFEKKAKVSASVSVGDTPHVTPGSLENASLVAWNEVLTQTEQEGKERQRLAQELSVQIADQSHGVAIRYESLAKKLAGLNSRLVEDRDGVYSEVKKAKAAYDSACQTVENQRLKTSKTYDNKSKDKASTRLGEKESEMHRLKNAYLVRINVANRVKEKFYHEDVPELLDSLQRVNESRVTLFNVFVKQSVALQRATHERINKTCLDAIDSVVGQNDPHLDSAMFVQHNLTSFSEPNDLQFEPSPIWHDDDLIVTDDDRALQSLKVLLHESATKLESEAAQTQAKAEAFKTARATADNIATAKLSTHSQILDAYASALQAVLLADTQRLIRQVEVETIEVNAQGKDLTSAVVVEKKRGLFGRKTTAKSSTGGSVDLGHVSDMARSGSLLSSLVGRSRHRSGSGTGSAGSGPGSSGVSGAKAKALYDYTAQTEDELSVTTGEIISVLDPDDGSGWIEAQAPSGARGIVPASYVEMLQSTVSVASNGAKTKGPAVAPRRGAKKIVYMIAQYDYDAKDGDELTIRAGDKIQVVREDEGDGWTEGELNGMSGVFPTTYAKAM